MSPECTAPRSKICSSRRSCCGPSRTVASSILLKVPSASLNPFKVQQECLPKALLGSDILTQAKSGMGKTAVFVLAVLNRLEAKPEPLTTLVICHTHELAYQIKNEFARFSKYMPDIKTEVIYGGEPIGDQEKMLKNSPPHILVATPGRVLALLRKKTLKLDKVKFFVVDECDKVLQQLGTKYLFM